MVFVFGFIYVAGCARNPWLASTRARSRMFSLGLWRSMRSRALGSFAHGLIHGRFRLFYAAVHARLRFAPSRSRAFALSAVKKTNIFVRAQIFVFSTAGTAHCLLVHYTQKEQRLQGDTTLLYFLFLLFHAEFMVAGYEVSWFYFLEGGGDVLTDFRAVTASGVELTALGRIDGAWDVSL